jgi:hypothetical protein
MAARSDIGRKSNMLVRLKSCIRPQAVRNPSKSQTFSKKQSINIPMQKSSSIDTQPSSKAVSENNSNTKLLLDSQSKTIDKPESKLLCQTSTSHTEQEENRTDRPITCAKYSENSQTQARFEGNIENEPPILNTISKIAKRTRKIVNWSYVSKFKDIGSAEISVSDGWRFRKNQCGSSYYKCCITRCHASMRIRTIEQWQEKFWILEKNDSPHSHFDAPRGMNIEAKLYIQRLMELGINKPKLIMFHMQQNVDKINFPIPTTNQINSYIYKK